MAASWLNALGRGIKAAFSPPAPAAASTPTPTPSVPSSTAGVAARPGLPKWLPPVLIAGGVGLVVVLGIVLLKK